MATQRPLKEGSVRTYQEKVALGFPDILASEMDADLDTIYAAWNGGIATANLIDGSVTTPKLAVAPNGVATTNLNDGSVTTPKLAAAPNGVATTNLNDLAVTTAKLNDLAVTTAKLADGSVTWAKRGDLMYARVFRNTNLPTIAHNTTTALTFDTVGVNQGGMYSAAAPDRFTIQQNGFYSFGASVEWSPVAAGVRWLFLNVGGSNLAGEMGASNWRPMHISTSTLLLVGNTIQVLVYQDSGSPLAMAVSLLLPNFWIARVG